MENIFFIFRLTLFLFFSLICSISDIKKMKVKTAWLIAAILCSFTADCFFAWETILTFIFSSLLLALITFAARLITKGKLGPADIYFAFFQGLIIPITHAWICLALESASALIFILLSRKSQKSTALPFIPFMSFGILGALIFTIL